MGTVALVVAVAMVLLAVIGPFITPHDPTAIDLKMASKGPMPGHPFGFDAQGRDIFSRILAGGRTSLLGPLLVILIGSALATALAVAAAWRRGWADGAINTAFNVLLAVPAILFAILAVVVLGKGLPAAILGLAIAYLPVMGRVVRSAALRETSLEYVSALKVLGVPSHRIASRHVVANLLPLIIAQATVLFGYALLDLGAISFLGLGVQQPTPDWGLMVNTGAAGVLRGAPAEALVAGACIVAAASSFGILGERFTSWVEGER
jgi:peptide/nickel transport system permease protein